MKPNGVHHVSMSVPSLDVARRFYVGLLGLTEVFDMEWSGSPAMDALTALKGSAARMMFLDAGNLLLEVFEYAAPAPRAVRPEGTVHHYGFTHVCFDVDDAAATKARLAEAGVRFLSEPLESPDVCTVYGLDPFGNVFELQEIRARDRIPSRVPRKD
jgi:catechol 2,3-dioxygenase-like lactoylglutathione lyase family enzyme